MKTILKYILLTAVRDRLYAGIFIIILSAFAIASILGNVALVEKIQTSQIYIAGSSRLIFAIGIILFVCFYVRKSFDNKEVEFILSKPISRHLLISSYLIGFFVVSLFIILPVALLLLLIKVNLLGLLFWFVSLVFETLIIITFCLLASLILRSAISSILASLGFYIMSRMMGFFVLTINIPQNLSDFMSLDRFLKSILKVISIIFPRFDLFAKSEWLIYGISNYSEIYLVTFQALIYLPLLVFMAFYDFNRKQF